MADETMFARLNRALADCLLREAMANRGIDENTRFKYPDVGSDIAEFSGAVNLAAIVRALLVELRTPSESMNRACPQMSAWDAWTEAVDFILAEAGGSGGA